MGLLPKLSRNRQCIRIKRLPPSRFIASLVELSMMSAAEWNGELVTDFHSQRARLREA
jgi:hypothetical protein